ncbi:MAG TPA: c-type cytochrome [Steroidobacteraceae bacterium]|nr:c-type cytochrome [Steroidobacteraceae bacterium]
MRPGKIGHQHEPGRGNYWDCHKIYLNVATYLTVRGRYESFDVTTRRALKIAGLIVAVALVLGAGLFTAVRWEGSSAREDAPALEADVAQWLLHYTVPASFRAAKNPLDGASGSAEVAAGHAVYTQKCAICHAYDGDGKSEIGSGQYPRPPDLRSASVQNMTDGEVFYHLKNGIRHTGMPAWSLPDRQLWQVTAYLRHLPHVAAFSPASTTEATVPAATAHYVGSAACRSCHTGIYDRWQKTLMANVVRDPHTHPDAIIPDLSKPDPLLTFTKDDIALVYGSKWKQRYFKKVGDDYFVLPAQWDVSHKIWRAYFVKNGSDWWAPLYPPDNMQRPTGPLCDGCHSVNYNIETKTVTEWNVGCERCHGPGSDHAAHPGTVHVINPAKLDYVQASDTCIQCHSQGQPLTNPIKGKYYDWPVGFSMGKRLVDFWKLEDHKLGELSFTHFPDGTAHKNRMQGNDFVQSLMYTRGVTCFSCHDPHGTDNNAMLIKPVHELCLNCHGPNTQNGPHAPTIEAHTHHAAGSAGSECVACHMPKIAQTVADINVRAHTFKFITPAESDTFKIPNACNICHADKTTAWATEALKSWGDRSPWRMAQSAPPPAEAHQAAQH